MRGEQGSDGVRDPVQRVGLQEGDVALLNRQQSLRSPEPQLLVDALAAGGNAVAKILLRELVGDTDSRWGGRAMVRGQCDQQPGQPGRRILEGQSLDKITGGAQPVSYTHLDVYKRQLSDAAGLSNAAAELFFGHESGAAA